MPFTFGKGFIWILLGVLIGAALGYLWHSWRCKNSATTSTSVAETEEVTRLRNRVANLEPVVAERDRLKIRVGEVEGDLKACLASKNTVAAAAPVAAFAGVAQGDHDGVVADRDRLHGLVGAHEVTIGDLRAQLAAAAAAPAAAVAPLGFAGGLGAADLERGRAVFGKAIKIDDLKIVEGIGPVLERVFNAAGIETWVQLAETPASRLREILVAADDRHRIHNPDTWPRQSELAALGEFEALKALQDSLNAGKE